MARSSANDWLHGSSLPYAEPAWSRGCPSPYLKESHRHLREVMRAWVEKHIIPFAEEWELSKTLPNSIYARAAADGLLMPIAAGPKIPKEWAGRFPIIGDVGPEDWDGFHDFIVHDEFTRVGGIGVANGLIGGVTLCMPAVLKFGDEELRRKIADEVLSGNKRICLAITEPGAGSDVQGVATEAILSEDKTHYVVSGQKKWITSGMYSDYFLTLTRTSDNGMTLLVISKTEAVSVRHMVLSGSGSAGTAFVDFDEVKVPVEHRIGEEGQALKYVMSNFNHERLFIAFQSLRSARVCIEDSMAYALSRQAFGKGLIDQGVVRFKFANMARQTEALQAWIESLIFQLGSLLPLEQVTFLAGQTAQVKAHSGIVLENVVREAIQIMGGIGLTRGGRGERVERIWRDVKAITIPGGSEDVLLDLSVRRALKLHKSQVGSPNSPKL